MKKPTRVRFKKYPKDHHAFPNKITAIFLPLGGSAYNANLGALEDATPEEYAPLQDQLIRTGYILDVVNERDA